MYPLPWGEAIIIKWELNPDSSFIKLETNSESSLSIFIQNWIFEGSEDVLINLSIIFFVLSILFVLKSIEIRLFT